jgi:phosphatidate cytidylyltransferase
MKDRILMVLLFAPPMLWALIALPKVYFIVLIGLIILIAAFEFSKLIKESYYLTVSIIAVLCGLTIVITKNQQLLILAIASLWWLVNTIWVVSFPRLQGFWYGGRIIRFINMIMVLVPTFIALIVIREWFNYEFLLLFVFMIWGADIGAYFSGKFLGKHKLAPKVSPGKTIEGVLGGTMFVLLVTVLGFYTLDIDADKQGYYVLLAVFISFISVVGDLFESLFKRVSNNKDSGSLLMGHGGFMDRIDSMTAASPIFVVALVNIENPTLWLEFINYIGF